MRTCDICHKAEGPGAWGMRACILPQGHDGDHRDRKGGTWPRNRDGEPS